MGTAFPLSLKAGFDRQMVGGKGDTSRLPDDPGKSHEITPSVRRRRKKRGNCSRGRTLRGEDSATPNRETPLNPGKAALKQTPHPEGKRGRTQGEEDLQDRGNV